MTVFWLVWDGAAAWVTDELLSRGHLPHLAQVRAEGWGGALEPSRPSCQTPPGLATLFTGTAPARHGVTGFWVPGAPDGDLTRSARGFTPGVCRAPALWDRLAADGVRSLLVHAPWAFDAEGRLGSHVTGAVEAYSRRVSRERAAVVAGRPAVWDDLGGPVHVRAADDGAHVVVTPGRGEPIEVGAEWTVVDGPDVTPAWYRAVTAADGLACARTGAWTPRVAGSDERLVTLLRDAAGRRPFVGDSTGGLLREGMFGTPLAAGGDGSAEEVLLSGARLVARSFADALGAALTHTELPDLVVAYLPVTDDVGHELVGLLDPDADLPHAARTRAWELVAAAYQLADDLLGMVVRRAGADDTVVVSADHGMAPVRTTFYPNNVLVSAGLAVSAPDGGDGADHARSAVLYHLAANGLVLRGGAGDDRALKAGHRALLAARDPRTGSPGVVGLVDEHGVGVEAGTPGAVIVPGDGVLPWPDVTDDLAAFGPPLRSAAHTTYAGDPRLHATAAVRGPVLVAGGDAPPLRRNDEVADLVARAVRQARDAHPTARTRRQLRLCVTGLSGAGKSTFVAIAREVCAARGLSVEHVRLAEPLYRLQQEVRTTAGVGARAAQQDQLLMESLAQQLRRLNPRALVEPVAARVRHSTADVVLNDDLRDPDVDAVELRRLGFVVVRVEAPDELRRARLERRGDVSTSDASTQGLRRLSADHTIRNDASPERYRRDVTQLVEVLLDPDRT
ncbi:alkaline phosphatase family protein [Cellulomonas bogoriensis]